MLIHRVVIMELKKLLEEKIFDMEKVAITFDIEPFDIYFLRGAACILGEYTERATRDFDFIDLADKELINQIIDEVLLRHDLYESKKNQFIKRLPQFRERYYV